MPSKAPARQVDAAKLLREAEEAAGDVGLELLDSRGLKRLTLVLERKVGAGCGLWQTAEAVECSGRVNEQQWALIVVCCSPHLTWPLH